MKKNIALILSVVIIAAGVLPVRGAALPTGQPGMPQRSAVQAAPDIQAVPAPEADFVIEEEDGKATITGYLGDGGEVLVPDTIGGLPVDAVGADSFKGCETLRGVYLPATLTKIEWQAFMGCTGLQSISMPDSVTVIEGKAFEGCTVLEAMRISAGITALEANSFRGCTSLKELVLPQALGSIAQKAFEDCTSLETLQLPNTLTTLEDSAFGGCTALTTVYIPKALTNVSKLRVYPFAGCTALQTILFQEGVTAIPNELFAQSGLVCITVPATVSQIGARAFFGCEKLEQVVVPDAVTAFGSNVFGGCPSVTLYCQEGSVAHDYALENAIPTVLQPAPPPQLEGFELNAAAPLPMQPGETLQLEVVAYIPAGAGAGLTPTWASGNPAVALVDANGLVTAVAAGSTEITCTIAGIVERQAVTVLQPVPPPPPPPPLESFELNAAAPLPMQPGETLQLEVVAYIPASAGAGLTPTWASGNSAVAPVDANGLVTAVAAGSTEITCTVAGKVQQCTITVTTNPLTDPVEAFVTRLYRTTLGRSPDAEGLQYWSDRLKAGEETGTSAAVFFFLSDEFVLRNHTNEEFMDLLYSALMNRAPDAAGKAYWVKRLDGGNPRPSLLASYVSMPEFANLCAGYGIPLGNMPEGGIKTANLRAFLARQYTEVLGRTADIEGLNYWQAQLQKGKGTTASVAHSFVFSQEIQNKALSDEAFVEMLYRAFMGRKAEGGGQSYWLGELQSGKTRADVFNFFANSPEFANIKAGFGV